MNCFAPDHKPDWKAYALGELDKDSRALAEDHASQCAGCREELATLRLTLDTLSTLREEEVPRRIAFVSDKVFEPRWYQRFFSPGFASACVVAAAITVHAFAGQSGVSEAEVQARIDAAVADTQLQLERVAVALDNLDKYNRQSYARATGFVNQ